MPDPELPPPVWVDTPSRLAALTADLNAQPIIAVDTESNSLHAYRERVCLIQFSTIAADYIVDPLALPDLSPLSAPLANPAIEKVFHAAEYDLICLRRNFGWKINSLFDTMIAVRTLGWQQLGLAALLETYFGVQVNKRYQRADWGKRPLPPDQLSYARFDTHYLIPLREKLAAELNAKACWAEAREEFERLTHLNGNAAAAVFDPENFWRISGARDLKPRQAAVLRELYIYREEAARRINRPPFKVMSEATLLALAQAAPHVLDDLKIIPGMTDGQIRRHGAQLLRAIVHGRKAHPQHPPSVERQDSDVLERYEILRRWRKQRAQERGVESDVIISREVLWEIALHPPQGLTGLESVAGFGPVRRSKYGEEIIKALNEMKETK